MRYRRHRRKSSNCLFRGLLLAGVLATIPWAALADSGRVTVGPRVLDGGFEAGMIYAGLWTQMMARHEQAGGRHGPQDPGGARDGAGDGDEWARRLDQVNRAINRVTYRDDAENWGRIDYWAAPEEFLRRGGDCEDYAIAKYHALKGLGFPVEELRLLILWDHQRAIAHAVLAVGPSGDELVLDNVRDDVLPLAALPHYQIHYSLNEETVLRHLAQN